MDYGTETVTYTLLAYSGYPLLSQTAISLSRFSHRSFYEREGCKTRNRTSQSLKITQCSCKSKRC